MRLTTPIDELSRELREETGRWLGKAIGLVRDPHECYEQKVRELWDEDRAIVKTVDRPSRWN